MFGGRFLADAKLGISADSSWGPTLRRTATEATPRASTATTTLRVGAVNDALENEARRVADQVMAGGGSSTAITPSVPRISRMCSECDDETLQREPAGAGGAGGAAPSIVNDVVSSPGQPLDRGTRAFYESRFGRDFGGVRIHTDGRAAQSAHSVDAHAYTVGNHVVFGSGTYSPNTDAGRRLIAHELTHVVQQSGSVKRIQRDVKPKQKDAKPPPKEDPIRKEAMEVLTAIDTNWKKVKKISSGFAETKGWISMGDTIVALIREHSTRYLDASAAGDKELVNDYLFLIESDLVAYQYVTWHAFVYSNLARLKPDIDNLVSAFDHDDTHHTGRADVEPGIRELKKWLDVLATDSANTLNDMYTGQTKARAGQTNEVTMTVTTAADKKKRGVLEAETSNIKQMQITVQGVLQNTNKFLRNATWEGVKYAAEAVKEFYEVRNKIIDTSGGPDYEDKGHLEGDEDKSGDEPDKPKQPEKKPDEPAPTDEKQTDEKQTDEKQTDKQQADKKPKKKREQGPSSDGGGSGKWECYGRSAMLQIPARLPEFVCPDDGKYVNGPSVRASTETLACKAAKKAFNAAMIKDGCKPKHVDCRCQKVR